MGISARRQPPSVRLRRLASELRKLRAAAQLTRDDVTRQTGINAATLYRIETGKVRPQKRTLETLLDRYGVADETRRSELVALSRHASQAGWLQPYEAELPEPYATYISFETEARSVRNYESLLVPGLLQTEAYATAAVAGLLPFATREQVRARVEVRMRRQSLLRGEDPLRLWAVLDEAALHRMVGGAEVMKEQLRRLLKASEEPHIVVQVLPFAAGAHPGMPGSFVVMDFPEAADPDIAYIDSMAGGQFIDHDADVRRLGTFFQHLQAIARSPAESRTLIATKADEL